MIPPAARLFSRPCAFDSTGNGQKIFKKCTLFKNQALGFKTKTKKNHKT
jgi:hypothetical protein